MAQVALTLFYFCHENGMKWGSLFAIQGGTGYIKGGRKCCGFSFNRWDKFAERYFPAVPLLFTHCFSGEIGKPMCENIRA